MRRTGLTASSSRGAFVDAFLLQNAAGTLCLQRQQNTIYKIPYAAYDQDGDP